MNLNKIRQLLLSISIVFGITFMFQYFFNIGNNVPPVALESGRSRLAPKKEEDQRPLNLEVNFCTDKSIEENITTIQTDNAKFEFTNYGAAIKSSEFKHLTSKKHIFKKFEAQRKEDLGFLVAFEENTPFYYNLVDQSENSELITLSYSVEFDNGVINKKYSVYKHEYKVDLNIDVKFNKVAKNPIRLRILYPSPSLPEVKEDTIQGVCNEKNAVVKKTMNLLLQRYWEIPLIFGIEDKYFVHSMVNDLNKFTQRGYYKSVGIGKYSSILESGPISSSSSFNLSFYLGPKQSAAMDIVEPKLESILDYGYLAPFSKLMLAVLVFFYTFFHNYGIAIILLTLLIKLVLLPFTLKGEQSMKKRTEFQKKLQYVQQKYKHDKEALANARNELMRENGFSDMIGCLPLLLQLPIGIALNRVLFNAIELYKAPFLWMSDLSAKDPYYILPILIGAGMIMHSSAGNDPKQKFSAYAVALVVTAFTAGLPAGLMLFIFMSIFSSVVQTKVYGMFKRS
ncbi:MAG: membrane protein insertase YidC [Candidatus Babeliales bacterium]|nr:membrane protein insertase YidC [Candidatus Babeliales bacterium]